MKYTYYEVRVNINNFTTWTYTPTQDLNGEVVFTFVVTDGNGGNANGIASLKLDPVETPPTANDVFITTSEDSNTVTGNFNAASISKCNGAK